MSDEECTTKFLSFDEVGKLHSAAFISLEFNVLDATGITSKGISSVFPVNCIISVDDTSDISLFELIMADTKAVIKGRAAVV